jgi:hypothetical protein
MPLVTPMVYPRELKRAINCLPNRFDQGAVFETICPSAVLSRSWLVAWALG